MGRAEYIGQQRPSLKPVKGERALDGGLDALPRHANNALLFPRLQRNDLAHIGSRPREFVLEEVVQEGPVDHVLGAVVLGAQPSVVDLVSEIVLIFPIQVGRQTILPLRQGQSEVFGRENGPARVLERLFWARTSASCALACWVSQTYCQNCTMPSELD